jgi:hypothetical protein
VVKHLPPAIHDSYIAAFAAALHPVFLVASAIALTAFGLSWLLRDVPLRKTASAPTEGVGETFAVPGEQSSARELERIAGSHVSGAERHHFCRRARHATKPALSSFELYLLAQVGKRGRTTVRDIAGEADVDDDQIASVAAQLEGRGLVVDDGARIALTPVGRGTLTQIVESGRAELSERCAIWQCDDDPEASAALRRVAVSLVEQVPARDGSAVAVARPTVDQ